MEDRYDYLVVGSGLAGLYSALLASRHGKVGLVTKMDMSDSNSYNAQGGIAAVSDKDDIPRYHFEDTVVAGRGLCDYPSVNILVNEGPELIKDLIDRGMHFDVTETGELALGLEGGHHRRRILHAGGDATGRLVTSFVLGLVLKEPSIEIIPHCSLAGLLVTDGECDGVICWDSSKGCERLFYSRHTILASGGTAAIYGRTTNPSTTTGDGLAIAYNAGCLIEDMEFIQFHPTAIAKEGCPSFLVSEAVRGEGAHLLNLKGERFMAGAHELAELAPRDVVAQMIDRQIRAEGKGYVYLSLAHLDPGMIKSRFPTIYAKCREFGIDMCDRIPVAPAAHYTVGGVRCNENSETDIRNLYVCGEIASTGIMGANRLASNSLIECMVFAQRAIRHSLSVPAEEGGMRRYEAYLKCRPENRDMYLETRSRIARIMSEYAWIVRDEAGLTKGLGELESLRGHIESLGGYGSDEVYSGMCSNLITSASLIVRGALFRKESRGCHYRSDYPSESRDFEVHTLQQKGRGIVKREVKHDI